MTTTPKVLAEYQDVPSSATSIYTGLASAKGFYIDNITSTNYSASAVSITLWLVPPGGASANSNRVISTKSLAAGEIYTFPGIAGKFQNPGSQIFVQASASTSINISITGREIT